MIQNIEFETVDIRRVCSTMVVDPYRIHTVECVDGTSHVVSMVGTLAPTQILRALRRVSTLRIRVDPIREFRINLVDHIPIRTSDELKYITNRYLCSMNAARPGQTVTAIYIGSDRTVHTSKHAYSINSDLPLGDRYRMGELLDADDTPFKTAPDRQIRI